jgi:ABC-type amino acid transport substrate-binding protein
MFKKMMLLATMALAVTAAAAPASALANWNDGGVAITANKTIAFSGSATFTSSLGGISCSEGTASATIEPGTTGKITAFSADNANTKCTTSGLLASCKVKANGVTAEGLPWIIHDIGTAITITGVKITTDLEGCSLGSVIIGPGTVTATPDNTAKVSKLVLSGTLPSSLGANVTVGGTLLATPATYGL